MPFRPCPSGCGFYLSTNDRHNRCVHCLGRGHADTAFTEGGCQACEDMPLSTLRLRAPFFSKKPRLTSTASCSGPSTSGYEAAAMCIEGEREELSNVLPAKAYAASGQAASALHTMAILQVYQAKVLKDLHEGVPDPELLQELRSATDYAL
ncbi:hypothetical protein M9458_054576 [Cirrhinus mrigala]|uniref:Uncharacterized protein n=1 Tax=Cirrhinus mrigala TaxID=683832 RepID=A0ABD0MJ10_CIRMR